MKLAKQFHDFRQARRAQQRGVGVMQMPHLAAFSGLGPYSQASAAIDHDIPFAELGGLHLCFCGAVVVAQVQIPRL